MELELISVIFLHVQVLPYTECRLSVTEQNIKETRLTPKTFTERRCSKSQRKIPHQKLLPECKNVTKANCVLTNWETDSYGNQVTPGYRSLTITE